MIDNFDLICNLIDCEKGEFFLLQILQRRKDGEKNKSHKLIKSYYVSSPEYLNHKKDEIKSLCEMFNARAYINLNKKSYKQVSLKCLKNLADAISCEDFSGVVSLFDSACGQTGSCDGQAKWVVDVDVERGEYLDDTLNDVIEAIDRCEPLSVDKVVSVIPTVHGCHVIARPFDKKRFREICKKKIDIHNNNHTLLYFNGVGVE